MFDLLILSSLAYLVWRVISKGFDWVEALFKCKKQETNSKPQPAKESYVVKTENCQKNIDSKVAKTKVQKVHEVESKDVKKMYLPQVVRQQQIQKMSKQIKKEQDPIQVQELSKLELPIKQVKNQEYQEALKPEQSQNANKFNLISNMQTVNKQQFKEQKDFILEKRQNVEKKQKDQISNNIKPTYFNRFNEIQSPPMRPRDSRIEEYEMEIQRLQDQIEVYKVEKKKYIQRIEDIIQHVNQAEDIPVYNQEQNISENQQLKAINQLKIELNNVHQLEKQKEQNNAHKLQQNLEKERDELKIIYEKRIGNLNEQLLEKQKQNLLLKMNQKNEGVSLSDSCNRKLEFQNKQHSSSQKPNEVFIQQIQALDQELTSQKTNYQFELEKIKHQNQSVKNTLENYIAEVERLREDLTKAENDKIEVQIQLKSKVESLLQQKEDLQKQLNTQHQIHFLQERRRDEELDIKKNDNNKIYQSQIEELIIKFESEQQSKVNAEKKLEQVQEELRFCQTQIQHAQTIENQLRAELESMKEIIPKKSEKSYFTTSQVQSHPEFLKIKRRLEQYEIQSKKPESTISDNRINSSDKKINHARLIKERDPSPSFPNINRQISTPTQVKSFSRVESASTNPRVASTIFTGDYDKRVSEQRYKTPFQKPVIQSTIYEGGIMGETFFGETSILNQQKRNFVVNEINRLKKISAKKTKLLYRSLAKNNKPITDYTSNVPNLFIVVQLSNKKIVGAFTQTAFTKELSIGTPEKSKYMSQNKAMLMDITGEKIFINQGGHDTIRHDFRALIWGKNEFIVNCEEPLLLNCELNCEGAIYPSQETTEQFLGVNDKSIPISQFEVFRIFLG